jgi:aspartate carbamoyltransferase catalytic subunit
MRDDALVMHPGPMNRGVEISAEVADLPRSVIVDQVRNGVATRMAVLYLLLGQGPEKVLGSDDVIVPELQEVLG